MNDLESLQDIKIYLNDELPAVGDRKTVKGTMAIEVESGYEMVFHPGDEISWSLEIHRISGGIELKGRIQGRVDLECYRCLEKYEYPLDVEVEEHVIWIENDWEDAGQPEEGEYRIEEGVFDILQVLRDVIGLSFPTKRLCNDDCKGLCTFCGQNLNMVTCDCRRGNVDARLKPLEVIKERLQEKKGRNGESYQD